MCEKGAEIGGKIMALMISYLITIWLTSRYKDNVHKELLDKHDEETANRLTEQFNIEVEKLKKEIMELKKELNITKKRRSLVSEKGLLVFARNLAYRLTASLNKAACN